MDISLRTLLDYLDDAMEPAQTKAIGHQIAQDGEMQELISRIRQVTRRRRLTTPPSGTSHPRFEAHTVAAYLDGTLPEEEAKTIEQICLESDVHLAELASCHQILTLSMGEPALVPPTAVKRMYGLVKGAETQPGRQPVPPARKRALAEQVSKPDGHVVPHGQSASASDGPPSHVPLGDGQPSPLGLPEIHHQATWLRWSIPLAAAALLLVVLAALLWPNRNELFRDSNVRHTRLTSVRADQDSSRGGSDSGASENSGSTSSSGETVSDGSSSGSGDTIGSSSKGSPGSSGSGSVGGSGSTVPPSRVKPWIDAPNTKRVQLGKVGPGLANPPYMLVGRQADLTSDEPWQKWDRLAPDAPVNSADTLMALPGFRANVDLAKGVNLMLWGEIPVFFVDLPVIESAVVLHDNPDYDVDLTLMRGRILLTNKKKESARVRVRFYNERERKEAWDILLGEGAEVGVQRMGWHRNDDTFDPKNGVLPVIIATLVMFKNDARVRIDEFRTLSVQAQPAPGAAAAPGYIEWDNYGGGADVFPLTADKLGRWSRSLPDTPPANTMQGYIRDLDKKFQKKPLSLSAREAVEEPTRESRYLGVYCLAAIDNLPLVVDALGDSKDNRTEKCDAAYLALQCWMDRRVGNDLLLYDALLKRYTEDEAKNIVQLLHGISEEQRSRPDTWQWLIAQLKHSKPALCYLAYKRLYELVPEGQKIQYNPAGDSGQKDAAYQAWKALIPDGKLPPPPKGS